MTSALVAQLLDRAGLSPLLALREAGDLSPESLAPFQDALTRADLLAIGAAADAVRRRECGDEARVYVPVPPHLDAGDTLVGAGEKARGTTLLRRIAALRLLGPKGARLVIDFGALGLEVGQVALSFGATDLAGPLASRRGLPLVDADQNKQLVKRKEIAAYIERAGFRPVFVNVDLKRQNLSSSSTNQERP